MKVKIKEIDPDIELGNNGIIMEIREPDGTFRGKLRLGKATVEWCAGKTNMGNGTKVKLSDLIEAIDQGKI